MTEKYEIKSKLNSTYSLHLILFFNPEGLNLIPNSQFLYNRSIQTLNPKPKIISISTNLGRSPAQVGPKRAEKDFSRSTSKVLPSTISSSSHFDVSYYLYFYFYLTSSGSKSTFV